MRVDSSSMPNAPPVVAMGASGSGKSTIGGVLADALGVAIFDGDSRHRPRPAVQDSRHGAKVRAGSGTGFDLVAQDEVGAGEMSLGGAEVFTQLRDGGGGPLRW